MELWLCVGLLAVLGLCAWTDGWWEKSAKDSRSFGRDTSLKNGEKIKLKSEKKNLFLFSSHHNSHHHQFNIWLTAMDRERKSSKWIEIQTEKITEASSVVTRKMENEKWVAKLFSWYFPDLILSHPTTKRTNDKKKSSNRIKIRQQNEALKLFLQNSNWREVEFPPRREKVGQKNFNPSWDGN